MPYHSSAFAHWVRCGKSSQQGAATCVAEIGFFLRDRDGYLSLLDTAGILLPPSAVTELCLRSLKPRHRLSSPSVAAPPARRSSPRLFPRPSFPVVQDKRLPSPRKAGPHLRSLQCLPAPSQRAEESASSQTAQAQKAEDSCLVGNTSVGGCFGRASESAASEEARRPRLPPLRETTEALRRLRLEAKDEAQFMSGVTLDARQPLDACCCVSETFPSLPACMRERRLYSAARGRAWPFGLLRRRGCGERRRLSLSLFRVPRCRSRWARLAMREGVRLTGCCDCRFPACTARRLSTGLEVPSSFSARLRFRCVWRRFPSQETQTPRRWAPPSRCCFPPCAKARDCGGNWLSGERLAFQCAFRV